MILPNGYRVVEARNYPTFNKVTRRYKGRSRRLVRVLRFHKWVSALPEGQAYCDHALRVFYVSTAHYDALRRHANA